MSAEESQADDQRHPPHTVGIGVGAVVGVLMLYVLSMPFILRVSLAFGIIPETVMFIYRPIGFAYQHIEFIREPMEWYLDHVYSVIGNPFRP